MIPLLPPIEEGLLRSLKNELGDRFVSLAQECSQAISMGALVIDRGLQGNAVSLEVLEAINAAEAAASAIGAMKIASLCKDLRRQASGRKPEDLRQAQWMSVELTHESERLVEYVHSLVRERDQVSTLTEERLPVALASNSSEVLRYFSVGLEGSFDVRLLMAGSTDIGHSLAALVADTDQNGHEWCRMLREVHPTLPILMVTEHSDIGSIKAAIDAGASDFISRPIFMPILQHRLRYMANTEASMRRIHRIAHHDALTGLPNRVLFTDRLYMACSTAKRNQSKFALMFIDLDGFKAVNDTYGHEAGDVLLTQAAARISGCMREDDTVARLGGDEFAIIAHGIGDFPTSIEPVAIPAKRIIEVMKQPFEVLGHMVSVGASIGIAIFPDHGDTCDGILAAADHLMYQVKRSGKGTFRLAAVSEENVTIGH